MNNTSVRSLKRALQAYVEPLSSLRCEFATYNACFVDAD